MKKILNNVIVVTGGAGLIGKEICRAIVNEGGIPVVADMGNHANDFTKQLIEEGYSADYYKLDITSKQSIEECITYVYGKYGKIDAVINNAYPKNKNYGRHFFDVEYADFCDNVNMNIGGYFLVSQLFSKFFVEQQRGNIINMSSIYGVVAPRFEIYDGTHMSNPVEYAVIKSGLIHLTKYMAKYLKGKNIRVNAVSLGGILDGQPESFLAKYKEYCLNKGMLNPKDITGTIVFLLSDESTYINGQNIAIDDGFTL